MKSTKIHTSDILFWTAGVLLLLTLLSIRFMGGIYSKYTHSDSGSAAARVAMSLPRIELLEHEAELTDGIYVLKDTEVAGNTYERVIPGTDINKDPFIRLTGGSEVSFALYIKVVEEELPDTVTYELLDHWEPVSGQDGVYKYDGTVTGGTEISILKDDQLIVSEQYVDEGEFSLTFSAWIEQID